MNPFCFQKIIANLQGFWGQEGCVILQPYDVEVGAGTFHPATTMRALGPQPWRAAFVQSSRRPQDGRYGENPNRVQRHHQFQVILKPSPSNIQDLALQSFEAVGFQLKHHDFRFVEDDWESPSLGASGLGWEVWCDGMEVLQFTYFQQVGGIPCSPVMVELAYGLERLAMNLQEVENVYELDWNGAPGELNMTYGDVFLPMEQEFSAYNFDHASIGLLAETFIYHEKECEQLTRRGLSLPAYDHCLHANHTFNVLDARGGLGVAERAAYIARLRAMAKQCFVVWSERMEEVTS